MFRFFFQLFQYRILLQKQKKNDFKLINEYKPKQTPILWAFFQNQPSIEAAHVYL